MPKLVRDLNQVLGPAPQRERIYRPVDAETRAELAARRPRHRTEEQGLGGFVGDVIVGAVQGAGDMVGGTIHMITHPIETVTGLAMLPVALLTRPGEVVKAFTEPYAEAVRQGRPGRAIGRGLFEVGSMLVGSGLLKPASGAAGAGQAVARTGKAAQQAGQVTRQASQAAGAAQKAQQATQAAQVARKAQQTSEVAQAARKAQQAAQAAQTAKATQQATQAANAARQAAQAGKAAQTAGTVAKSAKVAQKTRLASQGSQVNLVLQQARKARDAAKAAQTAQAAQAAQAAAQAARTVSGTATRVRAVRVVTAPPALREVARSTKRISVVSQKVVGGLLAENRSVRILKSTQVLATPGGGLLELSRTTARKVQTVLGHPDAAGLLRMASRL
ncbi:MAG: hypothetical protein VKO64_10300 [Candidatus Sericytochromatia bacterium]|nr:hypothetical protein [Candidatus Sericytochromatia bacterium]